ncbi:MAG: transglycosylase domain-containing protein [Candidatus Rokuibacteriota bacterium]
MPPVLVPPIAAEGVSVQAKRGRAVRRRVRWIVLGVFAGLGLAVAAVCAVEMRTSWLQAWRLSRLAGGLTFRVEPGLAGAPPLPATGPHDIRLGYARLPALIERAAGAGFKVEAQARISERHAEVLAWGVPPIYQEKSQAGLRVLDRAGQVLYESRYPEHVFDRFESVPALVANTLLFVENRVLLDPAHPRRNPAVDWPRLVKAMGIKAVNVMGRDSRDIGASTLATQIEKFRHSPDGRTHSAREKLSQMIAASLRAYQGGPDTTTARRQILVDYLNTMPLAAAPGHGEVHGLGDALWAWYRLDLAEATRVLSDPTRASREVRARTYRRVLGLVLAARRPFHYLVEQPGALEQLCDRYLRRLARAGVIDADLREAAAGLRLDPVRSTAMETIDFAERKGATLLRSRLVTMVGAGTLYDLDRLDLAAESTLSAAAQDAVTRVLHSLRDPAAVAARGLRGFHMLERGDPSRVIYSFTLYERGPGGNRVRVQTDSLDQPLDLNAGARIDLGSTAKLRTLVSYLEAVAALHQRLAGLEPEALRQSEVHRRDRLGAWAIEHLATARDRGLAAMLAAAMARRYPAHPGQFVTGGGVQAFGNFDPEDDGRIMSVAEGFRRSVNLVFIRLMRDIVDHYVYARPGSIGRILDDPGDTRRETYLARFADREGAEFIRRFYRKYQGKSADEALETLLGSGRQAPHALAAAFRAVNPAGDAPTLGAVLAARLPDLPVIERAADLHARYGPGRFSLIDQGFIARIHPLELWLVAYLRRRPEADLAEILGASAAERQEVYGWLFKTRHRYAQDRRIASLLELEVFLELHRGWQRLGYPFASLTPSLGTAIGSSGDRPAALAELMGIIVNDGIRLPTVLVERLTVGAGTPYEARLARIPAEGRRVMAPEVAQTVKRALADVVEQGTARSLGEALRGDGRARHVAGGKTGTGDHRYERYGAGGRRIDSRVVSRAATFVFAIDDRFFGTVTAYVPGRAAGSYEFTSALPVKLLGGLLPALAPVLDAPLAAPRVAATAAAEPAPAGTSHR